MKHLRFFLILIISLAGLQGFAASGPSAPGTSSQMRQAQKDIQEYSSTTKHERQSRMLDAAAKAAGKAAKAIEDGDEDAAREHSGLAIVLLAEAARECASVSGLVGPLADSYEAQGHSTKGSAKGLKRLFEVLDVLKAAAASTDNGGFAYSSAIREVIAAIYDYTEHGFDYWRVSKALKWLIWAITSNGYSETAVSELLDYLVEHGDLSSEKRDEIAQDLKDLAKKIDDEVIELEDKGGVRSGADDIAEAKRIQEEIRDEGRRMSEARKQGNRDANDRLAEEERRQQQDQHSDPDPGRTAPQPTTVVQLTSLEGPTEVSRRSIGEIQSVHFIAIDGTEMKPEEDPEFTDHKDTLTINLPWDPDIGSVLFGGTSGTLAIYQDRWSSDSSPLFGPRDREIVMRNTTINETIFTRAPDGSGLFVGPLDDYGITIDGQRADIIAGQPGEIAIQGTDILPNASGQSDIILTDRGVPIASGIFDSWGYEVSAPEVTQRNVWMPIFFQSVGVKPTQRLKITLSPTEGQTIEPTEVVVSGIESELLIQISQFKTDKLGPQNFYVQVEKLK